jgi:DNA invertase Pin-like site-specific DNA recombinase
MKIGYIRVSTPEQNTMRQTELMKELCVEKIFIDKATGTNKQRRELIRMIDFAREGDTVIVESISRFARNTRDFLTLISLLSEKDVTFISKKEAIDTQTKAGKFMMTVFAAVAELEHDYLIERQQEGIRIAKAQGKYKGRKPKELPGFDQLFEQTKRGEIGVAAAVKKLGISKSTWYRHARARNCVIKK